MKKFLLLCVVSVIAACSPPYHQRMFQPSDEMREIAKASFDQGLSLYNQKDYVSALPLFQKATQLGDMKASRYIGLMYLNGYGVEKDERKSFRHFQISASGDITGQYWLAYLYENGIGTDKNLDQAIFWYQQSAKRGDKISQPAIDALKRLKVAHHPS
ncbi:tetratricopeptide repeat protein [Pelistega ratti]|uniref:tetratricopeptide repeat protein n=1 Tax=Pelistega ratti TaxID=2652177 RepID=UPI00135B9228|nr:tetratricopeptide repeat protein [Pelistega ratti]